MYSHTCTHVYFETYSAPHEQLEHVNPTRTSCMYTHARTHLHVCVCVWATISDLVHIHVAFIARVGKITHVSGGGGETEAWGVSKLSAVETCSFLCVYVSECECARAGGFRIIVTL